MPPVSTTPAANFATSSPCVVDTGGKFATGVNDTVGKFAAGVNHAGGKLPPVSTTPAANLPLVSLIPVANNGNNIRLLTPESKLEACCGPVLVSWGFVCLMLFLGLSARIGVRRDQLQKDCRKVVSIAKFSKPAVWTGAGFLVGFLC